MKLLLLAPLGTLAAFGVASAQPSTAARAGKLRYVVDATGNEARYRVREQLVGKDVTGRILVGPDGKVVRDSSRIVVQVATLKSDQSRRDRFLRTRTLESEKFPDVSLVPTAIQGLLSPIPAGQSRTFAITGDMTVHGVTRPTTWQVTARADGSAVVGTATTAFTFKDFALDQPRVPIVLSVADTIRLEYDFRFVPDTGR